MRSIKSWLKNRWNIRQFVVVWFHVGCRWKPACTWTWDHWRVDISHFRTYCVSTYIHNLVVNSDLNMSMIHFTNIEMLCCCGIPETESNSTRLYGCFCAFRSMSKVTVPDSKQNENRNQPMIVVTNTCWPSVSTYPESLSEAVDHFWEVSSLKCCKVNLNAIYSEVEGTFQPELELLASCYG